MNEAVTIHVFSANILPVFNAARELLGLAFHSHPLHFF
jgi:hypothetical protein